MNKDMLLIEGDDLEKFHAVFLSDLTIMAHSLKEVNDDLLYMVIFEETKIKIRKILKNIGDEMLQICELMKKENNK